MGGEPIANGFDSVIGPGAKRYNGAFVVFKVEASKEAREFKDKGVLGEFVDGGDGCADVISTSTDDTDVVFGVQLLG